jgi:hypothetical protein
MQVACHSLLNATDLLPLKFFGTKMPLTTLSGKYLGSLTNILLVGNLLFIPIEKLKNVSILQLLDEQYGMKYIFTTFVQC